MAEFLFGIFFILVCGLRCSRKNQSKMFAALYSQITQSRRADAAWPGGVLEVRLLRHSCDTFSLMNGSGNPLCLVAENWS